MYVLLEKLDIYLSEKAVLVLVVLEISNPSICPSINRPSINAMSENLAFSRLFTLFYLFSFLSLTVLWQPKRVMVNANKIHFHCSVYTAVEFFNNNKRS